MTNQFSRTELLYGSEAMEKLKSSRVAVFGLGGVGGHAVEALARSGIGALDIIDNDVVSLSNLNRQLFALHSTLGMQKTDAAAQRIADINPDCRVEKHCVFVNAETAGEFDFSSYDYVVDAIDSIKSKILIAELCNEANTPIISSMGAGNKLHPELFELADLSKTSYDPIAKIMRRELGKKGIRHLNVVYSKEQPVKVSTHGEGEDKKLVPASNAFVPSAAGLIIASKVINDLVKAE